MKRTLIFTALLAICLQASAAIKTMSMTNLIDGSKVNATLTEVPGGSNYIYECTNNGYITVYNSYKRVNDRIGFFTLYRNLQTHKVWQRNIYPVYVNEDLNIIIGYQARMNMEGISFAKGDNIYAYELTSGKFLWQAHMPHLVRWGWNDVKVLPDGNLMVWTDCLSIISPRHGVLHQHRLMAGKYGVNIISRRAMGNIKRDVDADRSYSPFVDPGYYSGIKSNLIAENGRYYLSDAKYIYCLDADLNTVWRHELPEEKTSMARIAINGSTITLLNGGFAYHSTDRFNVGKPFIAQFDTETGAQLSYSDLDINADIRDLYLSQNAAFLLTRSGLFEITNFTAPEIALINNDDLEDANDITNDDIYAVNGGMVQNLGCDNGRLLLTNKDGSYVAIDYAGTTLAQLDSEDAYTGNGQLLVHYGEKRGMKSDIILANNGRVTTHFHLAANYVKKNANGLRLVTNRGVFNAMV